MALIVVLDATAGQGQGQEKAVDVPRRQLICVANTHISMPTRSSMTSSCGR